MNVLIATTRGEFGYFTIGMIAGAVLIYVFFTTLLRFEQAQSATWYQETVALKEIITHLETKVHPKHWLHRSDVAVRDATKQRFFDAYEELVEQRKVIHVSDVREER